MCRRTSWLDAYIRFQTGVLATQSCWYVMHLCRPSVLAQHLYSMTQEHPFLVEDSKREVDMPGWVAKAVAARDARLREQIQQQQAAQSGQP